MQKRGQFYLIAALVIVGIATALATIYARAGFERENTRVYDLSGEIDYESSQVFDRAAVHGEGLNTIEGNITEIANYYVSTNPGVDLLVLFGNETRLVALVYNATGIGETCINFGGRRACADTTGTIARRYTFDRTRRDEVLSISVDGTNYRIALVPGKPFLAVFKKEEGDERFVAISEDEFVHSRGREDDDHP
ncbi:hypothetical protein D6817_02170 [Candidatus Pacearchaeota archaeon]|nr:MAG: hypothetical protein D6817_02170 [Candidatus Pacearchaeota archaeon]